MLPPAIRIPTSVIEQAHDTTSFAEAARERACEIRVHLAMHRRTHEPHSIDATTASILRRLLT